jgi:hypothetical protein
VARFCRREGLAVSTFHWWRRRLGSQVGESVEWIEAKGPAAAAAVLGGAGPAVRVGNGRGLWIEFAAPPGAELLCAALQALRGPKGGASC